MQQVNDTELDPSLRETTEPEAPEQAETGQESMPTEPEETTESASTEQAEEPTAQPETSQPQAEVDPRTKEQILIELQVAIVEQLKASNIEITAEQWKLLLPEISFTDFVQDEELRRKITEKGGVWPENLFAKVGNDGRLTLDEAKFLSFNDAQRKHVLAHEASHRIDWLLHRVSYYEQATNHEATPLYAKIAEAIRNLPSNETSYYIAYLQANIKDPEKQADAMQQEKMAEVMAQYINSNGLFGDFITNKLLQFPGNQKGQLPVWEQFQESSDKMAELERFEDMSEEEQQQFLSNNPALARHYEIFRDIRSLLGNSSETTKMFKTTEPDFDYEYEMELLDYQEMANQIPESYATPYNMPKVGNKPSLKSVNNNKLTFNDMHPFGILRSLFLLN